MSDDEMKWRLPGELTLTRSDGGQIRINISQDGNTLVGTAHGSSDDGASQITGIMNGSMQGDSISLTIYWPDQPLADFNGSVGSDGLVSGTTLSPSDESSTASWSATPAAWAWE